MNKRPNPSDNLPKRAAEAMGCRWLDIGEMLRWLSSKVPGDVSLHHLVDADAWRAESGGRSFHGATPSKALAKLVVHVARGRLPERAEDNGARPSQSRRNPGD